MKSVKQTVRVAVPLRIAYDQWTQFESFPRFMSTVQKVDRVRPAITHWQVGLGPLRCQFYSEIQEQHPDSYVGWRSLGKWPRHAGEVSFRSVEPDRTEVTVTMRYEPTVRALDETLVALTRRLIQHELTQFKRFIERVGDAGEAWRYTIHDGRVHNSERSHSSFPGWPHG